VLEDEQLQLLTLRSQLSDVGKLVEFSQPNQALTFAREHRCDVAIVDVRMPRCPMDGIDFLRGLRKFDKDLAVIIRTADESDRITDAALELRAVKRAIKSRTSISELREATVEAIRETVDRREMAAAAREIVATKAQLVATLHDKELRLAAAASHCESLQKIQDDLISLSSLVLVGQRKATADRNPDFARQLGRCAELVERIANLINSLLGGSLLMCGEKESRASVNDCLHAVQRILKSDARRTAQNITVIVQALPSDAFVASPSQILTNGLCRLMEHLLSGLASGAEVNLIATIVHPNADLNQRMDRAQIILNRNALSDDASWISFRASGTLADNTLNDIGDALSFATPNSQYGGLRVFAKTVTAAHGVVLLSRLPANSFSVEALIPLGS
jgi:DNA-binding NarL/FixJ family response regulator